MFFSRTHLSASGEARTRNTTTRVKHSTTKSKEEGKDQEPIQSKSTPDQGHRMGKGQNTRKQHMQETQEVSPFPTRLLEIEITEWERQTKITK